MLCSRSVFNEEIVTLLFMFFKEIILQSFLNNFVGNNFYLMRMLPLVDGPFDHLKVDVNEVLIIEAIFIGPDKTLFIDTSTNLNEW